MCGLVKGGGENVLTLSTRAGDELQEVWNSGTLFQDSSQSIGVVSWRGLVDGVCSMSDTDDNGNPRFAVLQGTELHILEVVSNAFIPDETQPTKVQQR